MAGVLYPSVDAAMQRGMEKMQIADQTKTPMQDTVDVYKRGGDGNYPDAGQAKERKERSHFHRYASLNIADFDSPPFFFPKPPKQGLRRTDIHRYL